MNPDSNSTEHDNLLFSMLQECKTLPIFLDRIFGFLNRRTDFYHIATEPNSAVGLPPGLAEQIVKQTFYRWKPNNMELTDEEIPPVIEEVEIGSEAISDLSITSTPQEITEQNNMNEPKVEQHNPPAKDSGPKFTSADCYNGAVYENYSWSQSLLEVDIIVKVPENTSTKDLIVHVLPDKISVKLKNTNTVLLEGDLCDRCKHNEVIWSLHKTKLDIHLDKAREYWWNCLVQSEPKLDISKLDCSRPYEELPEEAQAEIQKLQWNQERKRLGLPTTEQMEMQDILKRSWDAEGSPFTGPFDPTKVNVQS